MSRHTKVIVIDDLDGQTPADETLIFGFDGKTYQIDLTSDHANEFRSSLEQYTAVSRKVNGKPVIPNARTSREGADQAPLVNPKAVREWARSNKVDVAERGRLSAKLVEQYLAAAK